VGINAVTLEAMDVTHDELVMNGVSVQIKLAKDLPLVQGDRVQLLQVMDNLIINVIEAMSPHAAGARDLLIRTVKTNSGSVLVAVCDSGPGVDPANLSASSTHISPRRPVVWERAYRSAARSSRRMGTTVGDQGARPRAPSCSSPYRRARTAHRELVLVGASRACAIGCELAAVYESLVGTKRTSQSRQLMSALWGKADVM